MSSGGRVTARPAFRRWAATLLVLLLGVIATGFIAREVDSAQNARARDDAEKVAALITRQLETAILPASFLTHSLDSYVRGLNGDLGREQTVQYMNDLFKEGAFLRNITLAPDNTITYVEPLAGNEKAIGVNLQDIPEQWSQIEPIIVSGEPALLGPFPLVQGGSGLAFRHPILLPSSNAYWGLASAIVDADAYLESAASLPGVDLNQVALRHGTHDDVTGEVFWGNPAVFEADPTLVDVHPLDAHWQLAVAPLPTDAAALAWIRVIGYAITILLAALVYALVGARQRRAEISRRLNQLSGQVPGMLFQLRVNPDGTSSVPYASSRITDLFGMSAASVKDDATPMWERVDPEDIDRVNATLARAIQSGQPWRARVRMENGEGQERWFLTDATPEREPDGDVVLHGLLTDVTDEVATEEQLRISASVFATTRDGVIIMDGQGRVVDVNPGFTELTGYHVEDVRGRTLEVLGADLTPQDVYDDVRESLDRDGYWRGELVNRTSTGHVEAQAVAINAVFSEDGDLSHFVAVISALSNLRDDLVTGLPARQMVDDRLTQAVERVRATGDQAALLVIGLDRFRDVNESLGHRVGDLVLKEAARRVRDVVPELETVARLGGDEFAVILDTDADAATVEGMASTIAGALSQPFMIGERAVHLTCSIGISLFPEDAASAQELLINADQAMRVAKDQGRDRYGYFQPAMQEEARERARLTEDLRRAIPDNQLGLVFQPVVDMASGRTIKAEALVRWTHPELGAVSPGRFIPLAEVSGQIKDIGDWVFDQILIVLPRLREVAPEFTVGFNLSPVEVVDSHRLNEERIARMSDRGIPGTALIAEITEGLLLDRGEQTAESLRAYRDAGLEFAIDDFGTGYSSLSYLQKLDVDYLKIDQSFVSGLAAGNESHALCLAIIEMAHQLGLRLIAEGIETEEQRLLLLEADCDFGQGYLFSRPIPVEELVMRLVEEQHL